MDTSRGIYYSAVQKEPEMHPLIEMGLSMAPYAAMGVGAANLASMRYAGSEYSKYDVGLKSVRNTLNKFPMGFLNTFRIAEAGSYYMTGAGLGLDVGTSLADPTKTARQMVLGAEYFNEDTLKYLRSAIGSDFDKAETAVTKGKYQFTFEMDHTQAGGGSLFVEEMEETLVERKEGGKNAVMRPKKGTAQLISKNVGGILLVSNAESLEIIAQEEVESITNPFAKGVVQNVDDTVQDSNNLFRSKKTGQQAKVLIVPAAMGPLENLGDLKRRLAVPTGYLSMGIERFNKVLTATYNQMPILGRTLEKAMDATGFSLKTKPGPFYKQYMSLGLKATKIGALYMGIKTLDHYREKFGFLGNMVASSAVAYGVAAAYEKTAVATKTEMAEAIKGFGAAKTTAKIDTALKSKIMAGAFAVQMLMPGFDKGIMEGISTTATNLDIGRSYIGKYTGLSSIRRGIEGIAPGSTEFTSGLYLGLATAGLAYSGYGRRYLERSAEDSLHLGDKLFKSVDDLLSKRFGMMEAEAGSGILVPESKNTLIARRLGNILYPEYVKNFDSSFKNDFNLLNPFSEKIKSLGFDDTNVEEYKRRLDVIFAGKDPSALTGEEVGKLKTFFNDNKQLIRKIMGHDYNEGEFVVKAVKDFEQQVATLERSEIYRTTNVHNEVNESLLRRLYSISERYDDGGIINNVARRLEMFGAEIYHSFFGATMKGEINIELGGERTVKTLGGEQVAMTYGEVAAKHNMSPIVRRFGALTLGVTLLHQMMTGAFFGMMEDPEELRAVYSGDKLVEVKRGRWWEAGGTPYEGGETSYFRPHAHVALMSKARERSVWGDETDEYSPLTRFFLKNFTYHLEEKNYYARPYPMSGAAFEDVPILGKLLASTIGRVVKPTKLMHEDELYREGPSGKEIAFRMKTGINPGLGELGVGVPESPYEGLQGLGAIQYTFREIEGLTGYGKNVLQKIITGREVLGSRQLVFETSNMMDSSTEAYWEKDLGGFGFLSEPIRRIFIRPRAEIDTYNPLMNSMPFYIPEKFKHGDPYRKLKNGFLRLPGPGYEAVNPDVAGIDPEDYPDIHKYKILADIAPSSRSAIMLREKLMERDIGESLTEHESQMLKQINANHQKRLAAVDSDVFHENAIKIPYISDTVASGYLGATELLRKGSAAIENLIPGGFRPSAKLLGHTRDAIETYEMERVYNTSNSFWDAPIRDWFRPALYSAANFLGWDGKPIHVQKREEVDAHFDKLQFLKFMRLADTADNGKDRKRYLNMAARTRTGVNPEGDALSMYLALPVAEKKFFDAFAHAEGIDRERILELVPGDQRHLYESVWSRLDAGEDLSLLSDSKALIDEEYMYQQVANTEQDMKLGPMPKADWIGWHKDVNISDIKVKYVNSLGGEIHDYDVWAKQVRAVSRKPYLESSEKFMYNGLGPSRHSLRNSIIRNSAPNHLDSSRVIFNSNRAPGAQSRATISHTDSRLNEMLSMRNNMIGG
jgi:hypothetical protein